MIFDPRHCDGCRLLARATGSLHALSIFSAVARLGVRVLEVPLCDVVVVLGPRGCVLPAADRAPSPLHAAAMTRAEVIAWANGQSGRLRELVAVLREPAPEGGAWALVATGTAADDLVAVLHHRVAAIQPALLAELTRALVPTTGGAAATTLASVFEGGDS